MLRFPALMFILFDISNEADETKEAFFSNVYKHYTSKCWKPSTAGLHPTFTHLSGSFCLVFRFFFLNPGIADNKQAQLHSSGPKKTQTGC